MLRVARLDDHRVECRGECAEFVLPADVNRVGIVSAADSRRRFRERAERARDASAHRESTRHASQKQDEVNHKDAPQKSVGLSQKHPFGKFDHDEPGRAADWTRQSHEGVSVPRVERDLGRTQIHRRPGYDLLQVGEDFSLAVVDGRLAAEYVGELFPGVGGERDPTPPDETTDGLPRVVRHRGHDRVGDGVPDRADCPGGLEGVGGALLKLRVEIRRRRLRVLRQCEDERAVGVPQLDLHAVGVLLGGELLQRGDRACPRGGRRGLDEGANRGVVCRRGGLTENDCARLLQLARQLLGQAQQPLASEFERGRSHSQVG